ncbi:MAG: 30S ribosomal protein S11 [Parcubacteria group bacterium CG08_land_8_20_14_0_20_43_9]|nr:MAG: 30S ribosomal protein S11 [Parcubacteria group bacterium CG08_land_8_20_14_0_20_43_9]
MGKKKIIKKSTEELFKEREDIESKMQKGAAAGEAGQLGVQNGFLYISSSYNNTILTLTDELGNVLCWISAGKIGFKGTKKGTPYAANKAAELMAQNIQKFRVDKIHVKVKGIGSGRESAVRALAAHGVNIVSIEDRTPIPHNGCRPPKPRRV